jgi:hypothetical protein
VPDEIAELRGQFGVLIEGLPLALTIEAGNAPIWYVRGLFSRGDAVMLSTGGQVEAGPQGLRKTSSAPGQLERETCSMPLFTPGHASDLCGASAVAPHVTEYQRHRLTCRCGSVTCGVLPAGVPTGQAGPRLIAFSGLLLSCFRQSKRRAALFLSMILHQPACPGWMVSLQKLAAEAVQPAYDEVVR